MKLRFLFFSVLLSSISTILITSTSFGFIENSINIPSSGVISTVSTLKFRTDFSNVIGIEQRRLIFSDATFTNVVNYRETARIEIIDDPSAEGGKVFEMEVYPGVPTHERCDMNWYIRELGIDQEFFIDSRLKLRSDYDLEPPHDYPTWAPWHEIMDLFSEWAPNVSYMYMPLILGKGGNGFNLWCGLRGWDGTKSYTVWGESRSVVLPKGEWFHLKVYCKRHITDGIIKIWINNQLLFDIAGVQTKSARDDFFSTPAKLYGGEILPEKKLWVDSIEIHDGIPT